MTPVSKLCHFAGVLKLKGTISNVENKVRALKINQENASRSFRIDIDSSFYVCRRTQLFQRLSPTKDRIKLYFFYLYAGNLFKKAYK